MLRQQGVEKALAVVEACRLQPRKGGSEIDKTLARRKIEQTQCARDGKSAAPGSRDATLIVHQKQIGFGGQSKRDGVTFACVERRQVVDVAPTFDRADFEPRRRRGNPGANGLRRTGMREFGRAPARASALS